jgi:hypothetical protein
MFTSDYRPVFKNRKSSFGGFLKNILWQININSTLAMFIKDPAQMIGHYFVFKIQCDNNGRSSGPGIKAFNN